MVNTKLDARRMVPFRPARNVPRRAGRPEAPAGASRIFLLSPAYCGGRRAAMLLRPESPGDLAVRLRAGQLTLGEAFAFMSGLYFRGKLAYARAFSAHAPDDPAPVLVITPTRGLQPPEALVTPELLREFASVDVDAGDARYRAPLERDVSALAARLTPSIPVILLGSIATGKYVDVLAAVLGARLHFPPSFVGRGDMSRGGLLLRSARAAVELEYAVLVPGTVRRGPRPPKLGSLRKA
jgi:hypothetical protein